MSRISFVVPNIGSVIALPNSLMAGISTTYARHPPANRYPAIRGPMMYPTPISSGLASTRTSAPWKERITFPGYSCHTFSAVMKNL